MKITTYNIHKGKDIKNIDKLDEMINYFKKSDVDILCLQEVLKSQHNKIIEQMDLKGCYQSNVELKNDEYGISIYYKNNINFHFVEGIHLTSKKEQRGFINAQLYINNKLVNICNTHLGLDEEERKVQINEIIDYTKQLRGKIFICGDFNEKNIKLNNYYDVAEIFNCENIETFSPSKSRIDYIFSSNNTILSGYDVEFVGLSDHYPVSLICKI